MTTAPDFATLARLCDRLAVELPAVELPDLVATLEGAKARVLARIVREALPSPVEPATLIDAVEQARRLNVAETWVRDAARRGRIPCVHAGVHLRFDPAAVLEAMKAGAAALPDRSKLSARGRRAAEHRIARPVKASKSAELQGAATSLLPREATKEATP